MLAQAEVIVFLIAAVYRNVDAHSLEVKDWEETMFSVVLISLFLLSLAIFGSGTLYSAWKILKMSPVGLKVERFLYGLPCLGACAKKLCKKKENIAGKSKVSYTLLYSLSIYLSGVEVLPARVYLDHFHPCS